MHLGDLIRQKRLEKNLTMEQLGNKIGKNKSVISKLENGKIKSLKSELIEPLAYALDIEVIDLFKGFDADGISIKDYKLEKISSEDFVNEVTGLLNKTDDLSEQQKDYILNTLKFICSDKN